MTKLLYKALVLLLFASLMPEMASASPAFGRYNRLNRHTELSQGHVSNVQQDDAGLMWFATWNGLLRYDGYNIYKYKPIQCSDGTIDSDRVYNIKFNTVGNILCVSSDNRLFLFNPSTGKFISLTELIPEIRTKTVKSIIPLKNGYAWVFFRDNTCLRLGDADPLHDYTVYDQSHPMVRAHGNVRSAKYGENDREWILTDSSAYCLTDGTKVDGRFACVEIIGGNSYLIKDNGQVFCPETGVNYDSLYQYGVKLLYVRTAADRIVAGTDKGLFSLDPANGTLLKYSDLPIKYIFKDSGQRLWGFSGDNTIIMIPNPAETASRVMQPEKSGFVDRMKNPQLIMETPDGIIVLKTPAGVLSSYDAESESLRPVTFEGALNPFYAPEEIKKYLVDNKGNLWVLHTEGIDCMSFHREIFNRIDNASGSETRAVMIDSKGREWISDRSGLVSDGHFSFKTGPAYVIKEAPDGKIWVGTKGDGVAVLTPKPGRDDDFDVMRLNRNNGIHSDSIYDITFVGSKVLLGSYGNGVALGVPTSDGWDFSTLPGQPYGMKVRTILPTPDNTLLIGTADGLVTTDALTSASPRYYINKYRPDEKGLKGNDVMSVVRCRDNYYVCVYGSGLSRIDSDNLLADSLMFTTFALPPSANADRIKSAASTGDEIWIVTGNAMTRFSPQTGSMATFTPDNISDGITFSEAVPAVGKNRIIAGTSDGIMTFSTDDLPEPPAPGDIVVTGIMYQNDMNIHPLHSPERITLGPSHRSFSLLLSTADYGSGQMPNIRYRLEGHDDGWNYVSGTQPVVTYSNLKPGDYTLLVETEYPGKGWVTSDRRMEISVTPRFTETIFFTITVSVLAALLIVGLVAAVVYFMKMRNALQKKYSLLMTVEKISSTLDSDAARRSAADDDESRKKKFIEDSLRYVDDNISNTELVVEDLARHLGMSRTAYYNMMKETTGLAPVDFIRQIRIKRALKYLAMNQYSISEVAYMVGFSDPKYFSRCFKAEMAMTPTQYVGSNRAETQE